MNLYTKTLTACLLFLAGQLSAQEKRSYDSSYQPILGQSGHARFTYYLNKEGKRIKEGPFQFQSKKRDSLNPSLFIYEEWKGQYAGNKKQGTWTYKKTRQWVQLEDVKEWDVQYQLKTEERIIKAHYTNDLPDKEWELIRTVFLNKEAVQQTEKLKMVLQNQRINGPIELYYQMDSTRSGRVSGFAQNGLMDSVWNFEIQKADSLIREQRQYKKGFLLSLTKIWQSDTITNLKYPLSQLIQASLNEASGEDQAVNLPVSLSFSDGYPRTSKYLLEQKDANYYLEEMLRQLFQYDPGYIPANGLPVGTNRGFYVLSSKEKNLLDKWPDLEYAYREKVNAIKAELDTSLATANAPALTWIRNWTNRQEYIFDYIKPWNNILSRREIEYYYRKGELIKYARELLDKDEIRTAESSLLSIAYEVPVFNTTDFLSYISSNFELRKQKADSILGELKGISREQAVSREKQALIQRVNALKKEVEEQLKDSSYDASIEPLMAHLKHYFMEMEYPRLYESFTNSMVADSITYLLESVQMIQEIAVRLPVRSKRIDSLYTIYTFDPFTFNDKFPRRIKKKLYDLIAVELYSDLLKQISINPSISEVRTGIRRLYDIQERLLFLHDKDTRKLERKLRKGSSIQDKLEVIKV
jgi:hypothetical protein